MMMNLKKIFLEGKKWNEVENVVYFEKDVLFRKNESFQVFRIFCPGRSICYS
jgi:hypothetical protein